MSIFRWLVVVTPFAVVIAAACGGGGDTPDDLVIPTATSQVSVEPSSTVPPSPNATASPTEIPVSGDSLVDIQTLLVPVCRTDPFAGTAVGFGTVPRAPESSTGFQSDSVDPKLKIVLALAPVVRWVHHFTAIADVKWEFADSEQDFAAAISEEGRRLWLSCNAVAASAPAFHTEDQFRLSVISLLTARQAWLTDRLEVLRTFPESIRDDDENRALASNLLKNLTADLDEIAVGAGIEDRVAATRFTVPNPLLEVLLDAPPGWLLIRNRIDIVLAAPTELQAEGVDGLGVPGWNFGTALRVRRFRHESPWTLADTAEIMDSLLVKFGERVAEDTRQTDGLETILRTYESSDKDWVTTAAATVRDLHTYLFELGCPAEDRPSCEGLLHGLLDDVWFTPR